MHQFVQKMLTSLAILLILLAGAWLGLQAVFRLQLLSVQTTSMRPTFDRGDMVVVQKTGIPSLGAVITYKSPKNPRELISHRVIRIFPSQQSVQTKGDALSSPDPVITDRLIVGQVRLVLPHLGSVLGWLTSWPGLAVCVYLPATSLLWSELKRLERYYAKFRTYRAAV